MANDIDPASSAFGAFADLGKRLFYYAATAIWGAFIGLFSAWINHLFSGDKPSGELPELDDMEIIPVMRLPDAHYIVMCIAGIGLILYGLIYIIKGSNKLTPYIATLIGGAFLAILTTTKSGWNLHFAVWMNLTVLTGVSFWLIRKWHRIEQQKWEDELNEIYEENKRLREEREIREEEVIEEKYEEELSFEESTVAKPEVAPIRSKSDSENKEE